MPDPWEQMQDDEDRACWREMSDEDNDRNFGDRKMTGVCAGEEDEQENVYCGLTK